MNKVIEHKKCRLCKSDNLKDVMSLGDQYVNNFVSAEVYF